VTLIFKANINTNSRISLTISSVTQDKNHYLNM